MNRPHSVAAIRSSQWFVLFVLVVQAASTSLPAQTRTPPNSGEIRGVWVLPSNFGTGKDTAIVNIRKMLDSYREAGINTLMVLVKSTSGLVYFRSKIAPEDSAWSWDFFGTFIGEARRRSMIVHPWFCVFTEGAQAGTIHEHPNWLIRTETGEPTGVVNPAIPEARQYEASIILELLRNYKVDWVHLDYIRYPCEPSEPYFSFDEATGDRFRQHYGEDPVSIRHKNSGNLLWNEWIEWDAEHVTLFIRELKDGLRSLKYPVKISAAVFPDADNAKVLIGQDWALWAREHLVDLFCPMMYTNNDSLFSKYLLRALEHTKGVGQVCGGIGIVTAHNQNTSSGVLRQIRVTQQKKASGFVIFSSGSLRQEFLDAMKRRH